MPVLFLFRAEPLHEEEIARLPMGCFPTSVDSLEYKSKRIVAQAHIRAPIAMMLKLAFELGQAIPDASFGYEEGFSHQTSKVEMEAEVLEVSEEESASIEVEEIDDIEDAEVIHEASSEEEQENKTWDVLLEEGNIEDAMEAFDALGAQRSSQKTLLQINRYFSSKHPTYMIFVCQAAIRFGWKTMVLKLRVGLRHEDPNVRIAALKAIGVLAGPSLSPAVQIMTSDRDEDVKNEAVRTLRKLKRNI